MRLGSTEGIKAFVRNSDAMAIVSVISVVDELRSGVLRIIDLEDLPLAARFRVRARRNRAVGSRPAVHRIRKGRLLIGRTFCAASTSVFVAVLVAVSALRFQSWFSEEVPVSGFGSGSAPCPGFRCSFRDTSCRRPRRRFCCHFCRDSAAAVSTAILPRSGRARVAVPDSVFSLLPAAASGDDPPVCSLV